MKKVLIYGAVKHAIEKVKEFGYEAIVVDQNPNLKNADLADKFKCIPFEDFEENLKFAKEEKIDGVVNATEFAVLVSSYVANNMNLPGLDFEVAKLAKDKFAIRKRMLERGITNVPQFFEIEKVEQLEQIKEKIKFPVILKPASGLGSLNVYRIDNLDELNKKLPEVIKESFNKKALVETFIEGQEYGVEVFVYNGEIHILAIMKKNMTPLPYRSELGHIIPSGLSNEVEASIKNTIKQLIRALGIDGGPVNFDMILTEDNEVFVVDVGARMGGNAITSHIIPLSSGIEHVGNIVKYAMNDQSIDLEPKMQKCVVTRILDLDEGIIEELPDFSKYLDEEVAEIFFEKSVGDKIEKYISDAQRCGLIILTGDDLEKIKEKANKIRDKINKDIKRKYDEVTVRKANYDDITGIMNIIQNRCKWLDDRKIEQWNVTRTYKEEYYKQKIDQEKFYVAEYDGKIVGTFMFQLNSSYAEYDEDVVYIHHLATDSNYKEIGKKIISEIKELATTHSKKSIRLDNIATNKKLSEYYDEKGFKQIGVISPEKYDGKNPGIFRELKID